MNISVAGMCLAQVVERAEGDWLRHPERKLLADRTAFTSGDFFKPGPLQTLLLNTLFKGMLALG